MQHSSIMVFEPPCTERYARWCERSGILLKIPSYSIMLVYHKMPYLPYNAVQTQAEQGFARVRYCCLSTVFITYYTILSSLTKASCSRLLKLMLASSARLLSHAGIVSVFLTDFVFLAKSILV